jgi:iron complex transport system substrate-binding protein
MIKLRIAFFYCLLSTGCAPKKTEQPPVVQGGQKTRIQYAEGFNVTYLNNAKLVEVTYPYQGATGGHTYLLVERGHEVPPHDIDTKVITVPLNTIVCTSTNYIPSLDYINETEKLAGFPTLDYISSEKMRRRIDAGKVQELGVDKGINLEILTTLKPDLVMAYTINGSYGQFKKMEELGIPVVINSDYLEKHPLGRAEWIKFMALFFNKEVMADSVFREIEKSYLQTKELVNTKTGQPTVMSGIVYGDTWFMPGGQNSGAKLLKDAGYHYLWDDTPSHGFLELSFESVYAKAYDADFWIGVATFETLQQIKDADHRYERFKPFKKKQVYTYEAKKGAKGGSEFLELGYLRPDIILKDLVKIAHPEMLPEHVLYFHKQLQ